jgi:hypothetical protein
VRRGTILGAIVIAFVIGIGPAVGAAPDGSGPWADFVVDFDQGLANNVAGNMTPPGPVLPERSDPTQALGLAESPPGPDPSPPSPPTWVSLGFGGRIDLGFVNPICNAPGVDLAIEVREITLEPFPDEKAQIYVSEDGVTYAFAGTVTKDGFVSMPPGITVANFVRVVDFSNPADFSGVPFADGFDLDGVRAMSSSCPSGKIEICKAATNGMAYKPFQFSLNGGPPFTVKGGRCTGSITTMPGLNVVEELPSTPPTDVSAVSVRPSARLISQDLPGRKVTVKVVSGSTAASETRVTFTDEPAGGATGDLKICKLSETPAFWGRLFSFRINGGPLVSTEASPAFASPSTWSCRLVGTFQTGSRVTVQEQIPAGAIIDFIDTDPADRLVDFNKDTGTLVLDIGGGTNIALFDNEAVAPDQGGFIEVCKDAARVGPNFTPDPAVVGPFTFTVSPLDGTPFDLTTYPGQCTAALPVPAGLVRVTEHAQPDVALVDVLTDPDTALLDSNLINRTADVEVPASTDPNQETQVHFVNAHDRSQLKLCKALGPNSSVLSGQTFTLTANGVPYPVVASSLGTQCVNAGNYPVGSIVTVGELAPGPFIDSSGGGTITIQSGIANSFTVTNTAKGLLEICKDPVPGIITQPTFRFRVDGGGYISVRAGNCTQPMRVAVGNHTVQEVVDPNYELDSSATGNGITVTTGREVSRDVPNRTVTVFVPYGTEPETVVTFTNRIRQGSFKICKSLGANSASLANMDFRFTWSTQTGQSSTAFVVLKPGACSNFLGPFPILKPDGTKNVVFVDEDDAPTTGVWYVEDIQYSGSGMQVSESSGPTGNGNFEFELGPGQNNTVTYFDKAG